MKRICFALLFSLIATIMHGQVKAVTENGDTIIIQSNGTWKYADTHINDSATAKNSPEDSVTLTNKIIFTKSKTATLLKKSKRLNIGMYFDPAVWGVSTGFMNESGEYNFMHKAKDCNVTFITETTEVPIENLGEIILLNAQSVSSDAEIIKQEYRIVNGIKVLCVQMKATVKGIKIMYLSYNYSNENGTVQAVAYVSQKIFDKSMPILETFLNGLVVIK